MLELNNPKVLIRLEQTERDKGKNVVIGDPRPMDTSDKILAREVIKEKTDDGKDTQKSQTRGGEEALHQKIGLLIKHDWSDRCLRPVRPVPPAGQTALVTVPGLSSQSVRKWVLGRPTK